MAKERRIGVVINCAAGYIHDVVRGISAAARSRRSWAVRVAGGFVDWVGKIPVWKPEGIIANAGTKQMVETLSALGVPVVNVGQRQRGRERGANVADVGYDHEAIRSNVEKLVGKACPPVDLYGDGKSGERIADLLATSALRIKKGQRFAVKV